MPPLPALYGPRPGRRTPTPPDEMLVIEPPPLPSMCGTVYLVSRNALVTEPRMMSSHSVRVSSWSGLKLTFTSAVGAALFTSVVIGP